MPDKRESSSRSTGPDGKDRRADPRYKFTADAATVEDESGTQVECCVNDLGRRGCYLATSSPLPVGEPTTVRITKGTQSFEAVARVVYSLAGKGMGLLFTNVDPAQGQVLTAWLAQSLETSWLTSTRRRSQRILLRLRVSVSGENGLGSPFQEDAYTEGVSAHGGLILLSTPVSIGQRLTLLNRTTSAVAECVVAYIGTSRNDVVEVGLAFLLPNPRFWNANFPPEEWSVRHPDAKSKSIMR